MLTAEPQPARRSERHPSCSAHWRPTLPPAGLARPFGRRPLSPARVLLAAARAHPAHRPVPRPRKPVPAQIQRTRAVLPAPADSPIAAAPIYFSSNESFSQRFPMQGWQLDEDPGGAAGSDGATFHARSALPAKPESTVMDVHRDFETKSQISVNRLFPNHCDTSQVDVVETAFDVINNESGAEYYQRCSNPECIAVFLNRTGKFPSSQIGKTFGRYPP